MPRSTITITPAELKEQLKTTDTNAFQVGHFGQTYCISFSYTLGGMNYATNTVDERGFELCASVGTIHEYSLFDGIRLMIHPVSRRTKKQERIARIEAADKIDELFEYLDAHYAKTAQSTVKA